MSAAAIELGAGHLVAPWCLAHGMPPWTAGTPAPPANLRLVASGWLRREMAGTR